MALCPLPPARLLLLGALVLGAGLVCWAVLGSSAPGPVGADGGMARASIGPENVAAGPELVGQAPAAPEPEVPLTLRLVDAQGRPLAFTYARVTVLQRSVRGARRLTVRAPSDAEGVVHLDLPGSTVVRVEVELGGAGALRSAGAWAEGIEAAALEGQRLTVEGVAWLRALTVDEEGKPSPRRRVLYREVATAPATPRMPSAEWSEDDGSLRLGPFDAEAALEVWPDARGQVTTSEAPATGWRRVALGEEQVKIPFPAPRPLRLRILGVAPDAEVRVRLGGHVADPVPLVRLVDGVWTQAAQGPHAARIAVIGPLPDGRVALLRDLSAEEEPIEVELEAGVPLRGRAVAEALPANLEGVVHAHVGTCVAETALLSDGTFAFPGLLRGSASVWVEARDARSGQTWVGGAQAARDVVVPLARATRVTGRIVLSESQAAHATHAYLQVMPTRLPWWDRTWRVDPGGFEILVPETEVLLSCEVPLGGSRLGFSGEHARLGAQTSRDGVVLRVEYEVDEFPR